MRDVGIANAVAGVVSNLAVIGTQNAAGYAVPVAAYPAAPVATYAPAPVAVAPAPAPVAVVQAPAGHYETQQVIVSPGHYEEVRVQIPQSVDPRTGAAVGGYTEMRQRWVPEVVEYRPVWVAP